MSAIREIAHPNGTWFNREGAPSKRDKVIGFIKIKQRHERYADSKSVEREQNGSI